MMRSRRMPGRKASLVAAGLQTGPLALRNGSASWHALRSPRDGLKAVPYLLAIAVTVSAQTPTANWPQFRGNAQLTGVAATTLPDQLQLRWTYQAGESIESSAAIADGVVYVGSADGMLHAVDLASGKARWKFQAGQEIRSSPNCSGNKVFIGSYDQHLYCLSAGTGSLIWKLSTDG